MRYLAATLAAAMLLAGCALFARPIEEPEVEVRGVRIDRVTMTGVDATLELDIFNPNDVSLPLEGGTYQLSIGGARAATGGFELSESIPARATAPVDASVRLQAADAARVGSRLAAGDRSYELTGELSFSTRIGRIDVGFSHEGMLEDVARRW